MLRRTAIRVQGWYYLVTGVWPLVSLTTFELVTGPKTDDWLVRTVGLLAMAIGTALLVGARRGVPSVETVALSAVTAGAFAIVDVVYPLLGRISAIYLVDAAAQLAFITASLAGGTEPAARRNTA